MDTKKEYLLELINEVIKNCGPVTYREFNRNLYEINDGDLEKIESVHPKLGLKAVGFEPNHSWAVSTLSMIATITDMLADDRLVFELDKRETITGVKWLSQQQKE